MFSNGNWYKKKVLNCFLLFHWVFIGYRGKEKKIKYDKQLDLESSFLSNHVSLDTNDQCQTWCWRLREGGLLTGQRLCLQLILGPDNYPFQFKWCAAPIDQCPVGLELSSFGRCSDQLWLPANVLPSLHWFLELMYNSGCSLRGLCSLNV